MKNKHNGFPYRFVRRPEGTDAKPRVSTSFLLVFCMKCILGKKIGMTQVFRDDGTVVPVTKVEAGPCVVTQVKEAAANGGVSAIQIGFGTQKKFRQTRALQGHLAGLPTVRYMRDMRAEDGHGLQRGDTFSVKMFSPGEKVQVVGRSKGKGFQGVVKRHGFAGGPASHGHKDNLRMPGSIGAGGVQRVFKDMRMGGHMGSEQVTVKNLEIVEVHPETNELLIKGAVPGAHGSLLVITGAEGVMTVDLPETPAVEQPQETVVETAAEVPAGGVAAPTPENVSDGEAVS